MTRLIFKSLCIWFGVSNNGIKEIVKGCALCCFGYSVVYQYCYCFDGGIRAMDLLREVIHLRRRIGKIKDRDKRKRAWKNYAELVKDLR